MGPLFTFTGMAAAKKSRIKNAFLPFKKQENDKATVTDVDDVFMTGILKQYVKSKVYHHEQENNSKDFSDNYSSPV